MTCEKLTKVDEPTSWCSNTTVREKVLPDGNNKVRLCLDPSQTLNKAIVIPHYQIPTIQEILPRLSGKKYKTFSIFDALDGFTQVALTDESSLLTTMHTPWSRYRWLPNKAIVIPHYQIPTIQEILPRLSGKKYKTFSIFDALDGFTQVALTDESSLLTTIQTPSGRYCWLRLPYGISSAPEEFQLRMHEALEGLQDVYYIADDILVVGQGETRK